MEKLSSEQQTRVKKMLSDRSKEKLVAARQDPDGVKAMSCEQLVTAMAHILAVTMLHPEVVVLATGVGAPRAMGGPLSAVGPPIGLTMEQLKSWIDW
jgi:hypothetical protein